MALFDAGVIPALDSDGNPISGATWYFYYTGTTTPLAVYSDGALSISLGASVNSDSAGRFVDIYLSDNIVYRAILKDAGGATLKDIDPVNTLDTSSFSLWVNPVDYGAVGDGSTNDTAALIAAIATGESVYLPPNLTFRFISDITLTTDFQRFGGPGVLEPEGNCGVVVSGATGVELDLAFNGPSHTGTLVKVLDAHRTIIHRLNAIDGYNLLYIEEANTTTLNWCWATLRGYGIKWYGSTTKRSDIFNVNNATIQPGATFYGFDWDGECHTFDCNNMRINCGLGNNRKGMIIRNTDGSGTSYPAIGRFQNLQIDYPAGIGIEIGAGLDYDFSDPYVLGATSDGIKITAGTAPGSSVDDYGVRIRGGKSRGNTGYGINNDAGIVLWDGTTDLSDNTAGKIDGSVWGLMEGGRLSLDEESYLTLVTGNPYWAFDTNDYIAYDRAANTGRIFIASNEIWSWSSAGLALPGGKLLSLAASATGGATLNLGTGNAPTSPNNGDIWTTSAGLFLRIAGVTIGPFAGQASTTEVLTGTDSAKGVTPDSLAALWEQGADIASAGTISIGEGGYFNITGTTTITDIDFATDKAGRRAWLKFAGILTLTNGANLILPTGANITTAAGDCAEFVSEGSDVVRCVSYTRASGNALAGGASGAITASGYTMATSRLLGRTTASTGAIEELTVGGSLTLSAGTLTVTAGGGAAAWAEAKYWDQAIDGSSTTIECDVTGAKEMLIIGRNLTNASSVQRVLQFSTDGGSTWYTTTGDYNEVAATGVATNNAAYFPHSTATTAARDFAIHILNNGTGRVPVLGNMPTRSVTAQFVASSTAVNRVRVSGSAGGSGTPSGTMNGGTIQFLIR